MNDQDARHSRISPAFAVAAFALAFLLTVAYAQQTERHRAAESRREQLAALVVTRQARSARIERELATLRSRAEALRAGGRGPAQSLNAEIERLSMLAGVHAARGPGVVVTLADSPLAEDESSPDFRIQDVDLQLVVNAIWDGGAEAVAVNGQRIVSTSAIRSAGQAILVNYKVLTSPYRVEAIGDAKALRARFARSEIATRFKTWTQVYRLTIKVADAPRLTLPAFAGTVRMQHASVAPRPSPARSASPTPTG